MLDTHGRVAGDSLHAKYPGRAGVRDGEQIRGFSGLRGDKGAFLPP